MENLHPITVHFPIALLFSAFAVETLALLLKKPAWHRFSLANLILGALGAGVAVLTGRQAEGMAKHSFEIHEVMKRHETIGVLVLSSTLLVMGWRLVSQDRLKGRSRWLACTLLGITCLLMAFGAHLGGRLVYEYGVGGVYGRQAAEITVEGGK